MKRAKSDCTMVDTCNNNGEIQHKMPLNSLFVAFLAFDLAFKDIEDGKGLNITGNNHINDRNPFKGL